MPGPTYRQKMNEKFLQYELIVYLRILISWVCFKRKREMNIKLFGIAREIIGASHIPVPDNHQLIAVADLKSWLYVEYPTLKELKSIAVAVDLAYAEDHE